jgi:hypothetical protein
MPTTMMAAKAANVNCFISSSLQSPAVYPVKDNLGYDPEAAK